MMLRKEDSSQSLTVESIPEDSTYFPLREKVTEPTGAPSWALLMVPTHLLEIPSHSLMEPSREPEV